MSNMFGGGSQGQFGGQAFSGNAMNPMAPGMEVQEVGVAPGEIVYTHSMGSTRVRDQSGRKAPYLASKYAWPWSGR